MEHIDHVDRESVLSGAPKGPRLFPPGEWLLDEAQTTIVLRLPTLYIKPFWMTFGIRPGGYAVVDDAGYLQRVEFSVVTASVDTGSLRRDRALRGHRFLDVEHFPTVDYHGRASTKHIAGEITAKGLTSRVFITARDATVTSDTTMTYAVHNTFTRKELGLSHPTKYFLGSKIEMRMRGNARRA